jgi:hypothetical protein
MAARSTIMPCASTVASIAVQEQCSVLEPRRLNSYLTMKKIKVNP